MSLDAALGLFREPQYAEISLPVGESYQQFHCRLTLIGPEDMEAFFPPGRLPVSALVLGGACRIFSKSSLGLIDMEAHIEKAIDLRRLLLKVTHLAPPVQKRQYFRINTEVFLGWRSLLDEEKVQSSQRSKVNLSGGGICFQSSQGLTFGESLELSLALSDVDTTTIECTARVVRTLDLWGGATEAALEFTRIRGGCRDAIIAHCLAEQRRGLKRRLPMEPSL